MINAYDFDGTIYDGDSSVDFFLYALKRKPSNIILIFIQLWGVLMYLLRIKDKDYMKEKLFSFVRRIDVDNYVKDFWKTHTRKIKSFYLKQKKPSDVIISASPEFLLKPLEKKYNFKVIATKVDKHTGKFISKNCHDYEKITRYEKEMKKKNNIKRFYSDSIKSDYPMLKYAEEAYLVTKDKVEKIDVKTYKKDTTTGLTKLFLILFSITFLIIFLGTLFDNKVILETATTKNNIIAFILSIIIIALISKIINIINNKNIKIFLYFSILIMLITQVLILIYARNNPGWDWGRVYHSALEMVDGKLSGENMWYFHSFPNNKYLFGIQVILFKGLKVLGLLKHSLTSTYILNIICVDIAAALTVLTSKKLFGQKGVIYSTIIILLSSPFYIYLPVLYTDTTAMPIPIALFYIFLSFDKKNGAIQLNKKNILLSIIFTLVAILGIKLKVTTIIIFLSIIICMFIDKRIKKEGKIIIIIILLLITSLVSINYIERKTHFFNEKNGHKLPHIHWVMMGLYEQPSDVKGKNSIGVYNAKLYSYSFKLGNNKEIIKGDAKKINEKLNEYGPKGYTKFLYKKSLFTWGDGTYNGSRIISKNKIIKKNIVQDFIYCYGKYFKYYYIFCTAILFIILITFIKGGIENIKKNNKNMTIVFMTIYGLLVFLLIWETSSRYLVHYYPLFVIGAIPGLKSINKKITEGKENE